MSRTQTAPYATSKIPGTRVTAGFQRSLRAGDLVVIFIVVVVSRLVGLVGERVLVPHTGRLMPNDILLDVGVAVSWWFLLTAMNAYQERILGHGPDEYHRVLQASAIEFGSLALLSILSGAQLPRIYFLVALPGGIALLLVWRWTARQFFVQARRRGAFTHPAFVVGSHASASAVIATINHRPELGLRPCGAFLSDGDPADREAADATGITSVTGIAQLPVPVVGGVEDVDRAVEGADGITLLIAPTSGLTPPAVRRIGRTLGTTSRLMLVRPALAVSGPRPAGGISLHEVSFGSFARTRLAVRRLLDVLASVILIVLLAPMWIVVPLLIWRDDRGPAYFRQTRVGRDGQTFRIWKFRTMRLNADAELDTLLNEQGTGDKPLFKVAGDPRITRIGRVLRRTSLDEFPQLFNVLEGSMSLVGPRPQVPKEVELYDETAARRLLVKPGMTGLWQVSGRSSLSWEEALRLDLFYVENWTFLMDLKILLRTVKVVLTQEGSA